MSEGAHVQARIGLVELALITLALGLLPVPAFVKGMAVASLMGLN